MGIEIYNNFKPQKSAHIDARLEKVANYASLPNPNTASNFIYEGAIIYVVGEKMNYQAQDDPDNPGTLIWVSIGLPDGCCEQINVGSITVSAGSGDLDMSNVTPAIETCHTVNITINGGTTYTVNSISNMPLNQETKFTTDVGDTVTFTHTNLDLAGAGDIVMEVGFNYEMIGRSIANESLTLVNDASVLCQVTGEQYVSAAALCNAISGLTVQVIDNLNTENSNAALSAYQGVVLLGLIEDKQDAFSIAGLLQWNNDESVLTGKYPDFIETLSPPNINNVGGYLTSQVPGYTQHHIHHVRGSFSSMNGKWLLPGGKDPANFNNWIQLSSDYTTTKPFANISVFGENPVDATNAESNGYYHFRMANTLTTNEYGNTQIDFNPADGDFEKVNFRLKGETFYTIEANITVESDQFEDFFMALFENDVFGDLTDALPGSFSYANSNSNLVAHLPHTSTQSKGTYHCKWTFKTDANNRIFSLAWVPNSGVASPNTATRIVIGGNILVREITNGE